MYNKEKETHMVWKNKGWLLDQAELKDVHTNVATTEVPWATSYTAADQILATLHDALSKVSSEFWEVDIVQVTEAYWIDDVLHTVYELHGQNYEDKMVVYSDHDDEGLHREWLVELYEGDELLDVLYYCADDILVGVKLR